MIAAIRAWVEAASGTRRGLRAAGVVLLALLLLDGGITLYWTRSPPPFDVSEAARQRAGGTTEPPVRGAVTTAALAQTIHTLLNKPGGYLSNDVTPPGVLMDDMPNWEWGVLVQCRDLAIALRNDFSRAQTQSTEDPDLIKADNELRINSEAWLFPNAETEYASAEAALDSYLRRISSPTQPAQFYTRADNLQNWLAVVEKRLGDLTQRLSASVGQTRVNTDLAGDTAAERSTPATREVVVKTPWLKLDDVFYEARGTSWALLQFLRAVEIDFAPVLEKRNALVSLRQIIRELEGSQAPLWSPMVLNGDGFGIIANHSLVMASYLARANAAVIELRLLLEHG